MIKQSDSSNSDGILTSRAIIAGCVPTLAHNGFREAKFRDLTMYGGSTQPKSKRSIVQSNIPESRFRAAMTGYLTYYALGKIDDTMILKLTLATVD